MKRQGTFLKLGVYGGSFNPIHKGHIHLALQFLQALQLEKILIVPTNYTQHKFPDDMLDFKQRLAMCSLACKKYAALEVCGIEQALGEKSYTVNTLQAILRMYEAADLFLLMGSDTFASIGSWYKFDELKELAVLCAAPRYAGELKFIEKLSSLLRKKGARTIINDGDVVTMSSAEIRKKIKNNEEIHDFLDDEVAQYIIENELYRS